MYLSRFQLDTNRRETVRALNMPNILHGAVERAFSGGRARRLWRVDTVDGKRYVLILSEDSPNLDSAAEQYGFPNAVPSWEIRNYDTLLSRVNPGSRWFFRLTANPTKSVVAKDEDGNYSRGSVAAHVTVEYQKQWLLERAAKHGFELLQDEFTVTESRWYSFSKGSDKRRVTLRSVSYEGILRVSDSQLMRETLINGIGRGKAYGMGLLTLVSSPHN